MSTQADNDRWRPDDQLIPAVLAGCSSTTMATLADVDRAWLIAGLRRAGQTFERIAELLSCSLRTVHVVAADPAAAVCALLQDETEHFTSERRMAEAEQRRLRQSLCEAVAARDRYRAQLDRLLDAHLTGGSVSTFPCGCPRTPYNTYTAPRTGKHGCREHRRLAVVRHRERARMISDGIILP